MASSTNASIQNNTWDWFMDTEFAWIKPESTYVQYLKTELINSFFPALRTEDKNLLLDGIIKIINFIYIKNGFHHNSKNSKKNQNLLWNQLKQNKLLDLRALLAIMLPFINDNETDDKKRRLKKLEDLYLEVDDKGAFVYTNQQYNRCIRSSYENQIVVLYRPFIKDYFDHHLQLLLMSIEYVSNKLYVNWVDVLPMKMNEFTKSQLYLDTVDKITGSNKMVNLINHYLDPNPGISYQDFYNVMSNHLYEQIKDHKWLIYDIIIQNELVSYITYLESQFDFKKIWDGVIWSQLSNNEINIFASRWTNFLNSYDINDNTILIDIHSFFSINHKNANRLTRLGRLIPSTKESLDLDQRLVAVTSDEISISKRGMKEVPVEEIYLFFYDQLQAYKKSWYYYVSKIKKEKNLATEENQDSNGIRMLITPKNIYNYCKSMVHYTPRPDEFIRMPRYWCSLKPELINIVLIRMIDITDSLQNDPTKNNWFNVNNYIRRFYPQANEKMLPELNHRLHILIRSKIVGIVFESLIYHGLLSEFVPNKTITDNMSIDFTVNTTDDRKRTEYKRNQMKKQYFTGINQIDYEKHAYYYVTGNSYGELPVLKSKNYPKNGKTYFDFLVSDQIWTFTYAMNWISQINFYHHYLNNRVIYVTGATGVGKSTQVPKLLLYAQHMLDFNLNGKIICTQPRIPPTITNAETISKELGVPIKAYNPIYDKEVFTSNYYVQYRHQQEEHTNNTDSFLKIVTDGSLISDIRKYPFLTTFKQDKSATDSNGKPANYVRTFDSKNIYDIVIVDEAHEHNKNMDMILTLVRDIAYFNNSLKLVIVSATMEDDEPIYRRYYRNINDNRICPLSAFIESSELDRANMDRRIHISMPGTTTQYTVKDHYLSKSESDKITSQNYVEYGINKTIKLANSTTSGDILLFMAGQSDITESIKKINANTPPNIITFGYYREMDEEMKEFILKIDKRLPEYTRFKDDISLDEKDVTRRVTPGIYTRAIIVATNIAEASITLSSLRYVVDTGYAKVNMYDPLENISKIITLPISKSSSIQRRGRVGRVASGEVYYLYDKEKIINNKTTYKIADEDVTDIIINFLKSNQTDSFIIMKDNDINNISNLLEINEQISSHLYSPKTFVYDILKNPKPFLKIIEKQYLYIPNLSDVQQYYIYYGKTDKLDYSLHSLHSLHSLQEIQDNFLKYLEANHDDYHYQTELSFRSRAFTGYDDFILEDKSLTFYIIHPDENVIIRNLFTGNMVGLKYNPAVSNAYYYYLLKSNDILVDEKSSLNKFNFKNIDYRWFALLKYRLAIDNAKLQLLVIDVPAKNINPEIIYTNISDPDVKRDIHFYYQKIYQYFEYSQFVTVKSSILANLDNIQQMISSTILDNIPNLLWFTYAIPYDCQDDIVALITLIRIMPDIKKWIHIQKPKRMVMKFFAMHYNKEGDIYFLWKLWTEIKDVLSKKHLFELTKIGINIELLFKKYKQQYLENIEKTQQILPFEQFKIFEEMYKSGHLNVDNEYYYYLGLLSIDPTVYVHGKGMIDEIDIISKNHNFDPSHLQEFIVEYLSIQFNLNKKIWMYQYEINNQLTDEEEQSNIIDWAENLSLPKIIYDTFYTPTKWDHIFEAYLRAFSTNLIKNNGTYYLKLNNAVRMDKKYWSDRIRLEETFLNNKTEYMIYHHDESQKQQMNVIYLTPVKLEWILILNPIYYFYFFFDKRNILYFMKTDEDVSQAIKIINSNKHLFRYDILMEYLDKINNPNISEIIRNEIYDHIQPDSP